jgi:translocation and assembly module TamB
LNRDPDRDPGEEPATDGQGAVAPRRQRRPWPWLAGSGALLLGLVGVAWLFASEAGLRLACQMVERLAAGQLSIVAPAGALGGSFSVPSVHWRSETLDVQVQDLQLDWRPAELLHGRLAVSRIAAASLRLANVASSEPLRLPDSLRLPLAIEVDQLAVGRIEVGDHAYPEGKAVLIAEALAARLSSDGMLHRLPELQASIAGLTVVGEASLAAERPFALQAKAGIEGEAAGRQLAFDLAAEGRLEEFVLLGNARPLAARSGKDVGKDFAGELSARISPFASQPVREAVVSLSAIDPAAWIAGAPQAALDLRVDLQPLGDAGTDLGGRLRVVNRLPGAIDRQRRATRLAASPVCV